MINLLKADLYRLLRSRLFYVCIILMAVYTLYNIWSLVPLTFIGVPDAGQMNKIESEYLDPYMKEAGIDKISASARREIILTAEWYKSDRLFLAQNYLLYYFLVIVAMSSAIDDVSEGCIRNTISSNTGRKKYYLAKNLFVLMVGLTTLIFGNTMIYILNRIINGSVHASDIGTVCFITLFQIFPMVLYSNFIVMISLNVRKKFKSLLILLPADFLIFILLYMVAGLYGLIDDKVILYVLACIPRIIVADMSVYTNSYLLIVPEIFNCTVASAAFYLIGYKIFGRREAGCT